MSESEDELDEQIRSALKSLPHPRPPASLRANLQATVRADSGRLDSLQYWDSAKTPLRTAETALLRHRNKTIERQEVTTTSGRWIAATCHFS